MSIIYINPFQFAAPAGGYDADAQAYITAVEAADGQSLEVGVKDAINALFVGCKTDGNFSALKAACILAGARTRTGALVPLLSSMPAPTSFGFVDADYDRKTGLKGDASTKYLDSNRNNNADPQNSKHLSTYVTEFATAKDYGANIGFYTGAGGSSYIGRNVDGSLQLFCNSANSIFGSTAHTGFQGISRASSTAYSYRMPGSQSGVLSVSSQTPANGNIQVFSAGDSLLLANPRLSFYSIGESLDLALLDTRVSTLMSALAAAIP